MGLRTFAISFSNRLPPRRGKCSCRCFVTFSTLQSKRRRKIRTKSTQIFHWLQSSPTNACLAGLNLSGNTTESHAENFLPLQQVLIYNTYVLPQLCQFWEELRGELAGKRLYQRECIGDLRLRLPELQAENQIARKIRKKGLKEDWEEIDGVLHREGFLYLPEIIKTEMISRHHDDPLVGHFRVEKTRKLDTQKYYWPTLQADIEVYLKGCDVCITSEAVRHKPYGDLQSLPMPTHRWKDLSMDFVTCLPVSINLKGKTYDSILVIVDRLTKMVDYEPVKVNMDGPSLAKVIIDVVVQHHGLLDSIVSNRGSIFTSKFWSLLCYFLDIRRKLSIAF